MTKRIFEVSLIALLLSVGIGPFAWCSECRTTPLVRAVSAVQPSVVNIHTRKLADQTNALFAAAKPRKVSGMGTGVVIDERGYIVTNHHVVDQVDESSLRVTLHDGSTYQAKVISYDSGRDLAILKIQVKHSLTVMPMGTSSDVMLGETVFAIGNAFGYEHSVTSGIVSALSRDVDVNETQSYEDLIQTDASINPGNSGGPLINLDGKVIGINVAIRAGAQRIGFAIPIDAVRVTIARLLDIERLSYTVHGIRTRDVKSADDCYLVVESAASESPAGTAGFETGDIIRETGSIRIVDGADLERSLLGRRAGEAISVEITRGGEQRSLTLTLVKRQHDVKVSPATKTASVDSAATPSRLWKEVGLSIASVTERERAMVAPAYNGALRVTAVRSNSPASAGRIRPGDLLLGLHEWETIEADDIEYVLDQFDATSSRSVEFYIFRVGSGVMIGRLPLPD